MDKILNALSDFGLSVSSPIVDGNIHRCHSNSKNKRNNAGWYSIKEHNSKFYGVYGCWHRGENGRASSDGESGLRNNSEVWALLTELQKVETEKVRLEGIEISSAFLSQCGPSSGDHDYLKRKKVSPCGLYQKGDLLVVPVFWHDGTITSYQTIASTGTKSFMYGGAVGGGCYPIKGTDGVICVCEGFATGATINQATGYKTLVAFNAGNLGKVAKYAIEKFPNANILICADNDHAKEDNVGLKKGRQAALELGLDVVWPEGIDGSDFNDMADEIDISSVSDIIVRGRVIEIYKSKKRKQQVYADPPGILKDIQDYYNATAIKPQPLFGLATGLILGSVVLGRRYHTGQMQNYTSQYFLLVAKSGTGKDHPKSIVRKLLKKSCLSWMERAGGYTASNTLMKSLQRQPLQVSFFEEIGQKLSEASGNSRSMASGVFRQMLDIWSSCHSMTVGDEYSDGTVPTVEKPALTTVGITTPRELYKAVNESLIEQGFVNRLMPFISEEGRKASKLVLNNGDGADIQAMEDRIVKWIQNHWPMFSSELGCLLEPDEDFLKNPSPEGETEIPFTHAAIDYLNLVEEDVVMLADSLEKCGLDDLLSRSREHAMRNGLIAAVMSGCTQVDLEHVQWAYSLVSASYETFIEMIKRNVSGSDFEEYKLDALMALRLAGEKGIKPAVMPKTTPFSRWTKKEREEILNDLADSELADKIRVRTGKRGPGAEVWVALK